MKIAYLETSPDATLFGIGGVPTHAKQLIQNFKKAGHEVQAFFAQDMIPLEEMRLLSIEKNRSIGSLKKWIPGFLWESAKEINYLIYDRQIYGKILKRMAVNPPDILFERIMFRSDAGCAISRKLKIPRVVDDIDPFALEQSQNKSLFQYFRKKKEIEKITSADHIISSSQALKRHFLDSVPVEEENISVIPSSADPDHFNPEACDRDSIRRRYVGQGTKLIGFVGYFAAYHGVECLIEAANLLRDENVAFLLVGSGQCVNFLNEKISDLKLKNKVYLTGLLKYEDVPNYIAAMDITVIPDFNWFGSPTKLFEYGAMEKPIIAPNVAPVKEVMTDQKDGIIIEPGNPHELSQAIRHFLNDPVFAEACAKAFRAKVIQNYRWDLKSKKTISIFEQVLKKSNQKVPI